MCFFFSLSFSSLSLCLSTTLSLSLSCLAFFLSYWERRAHVQEIGRFFVLLLQSSYIRTYADLHVHGPAMTQTSPREFQSDRRHTETDSTLRLSGAGHSRSSHLGSFPYCKVDIRLRRDPIMSCCDQCKWHCAARCRNTQRQTSINRKKNSHQHALTPAHPVPRTPVRLPTRTPGLVCVQILTFEIITKN